MKQDIATTSLYSMHATKINNVKAYIDTKIAYNENLNQVTYVFQKLALNLGLQLILGQI